MLGIVYPICCGIDVHKSFLVACIASTNSQGVTIYKSKRFSTFTGDLRRCAEGLAKNNCKDVCMESTGKYWFPIYDILNPACNIVLAHLKYVKAIRGKKTNKKDTKWIAGIFGIRKLYPSGGYSSASGLGSLSPETHQLHHWQEKPSSELPHRLQHQAE